MSVFTFPDLCKLLSVVARLNGEASERLHSIKKDWDYSEQDLWGPETPFRVIVAPPCSRNQMFATVQFMGLEIATSDDLMEFVIDEDDLAFSLKGKAKPILERIQQVVL